MLRALMFGVIAGLLLVGGVGAACGSDDGDAIEYEVVVRFHETVAQADMDDVAAFLRTYDDDLDFLIQESFPPTGVARVKTDDAGFCAAVESELEAKSYIESVTCGENQNQTPVDNPDQPVSYP